MADNFFDDDDDIFATETETDVKEFESYMNDEPVTKTPPPAKDVKPATEADKEADKQKESTADKKAEAQRLAEEAKEKEEEEHRKFIEGEDNTKPSKDKKTNTEDSEEDEEEVEGIAQLAQDLYKVGIFNKYDDEEELPETTEEFIEKFNDEKRKVAEELVYNFAGRHGEDFRDAFNAIFVDGVDPQEYLSKYMEVSSFKDMDITDEDNQKRVIQTSLKNQGWEDADIKEELKKLELNSDLETTATRYHKALVKSEEHKLTRLQEETRIRNEQKKLQIQQEAQNIRTIMTEALKKQELDGVPVTREDVPKIIDTVEKKTWKMPDGSLITDYECALLELNRPGNHTEKLKLAALIRRAMGDDWQPGKPLKFDFGPIGKKAVSKESNEVFNWVKSKSSKSTTGKKVTTGEDTDFWKTIE
jgi:hypothetical protein